jgi:hypothetical protein
MKSLYYVRIGLFVLGFSFNTLNKVNDFDETCVYVTGGHSVVSFSPVQLIRT